MFDDLTAYFYENIMASYMEYRDVREKQSYGKSKDTRTAIIAATALFHLREHVPRPHQKSRSDIAKACADYDLLGDIVNTAKHRGLDRGNPKLNSAQDIYELTVVTQYEDMEGVYFDANKMVIAKLLDGTEIDIFTCLTNVINYWGNEFVRLGIIKSFSNFPILPPVDSIYVPRDRAKQMDIEIIQGVRFKQMLKLLKFNSTTGKSEPIDLTNANIKAKIYTPPVFDLHLTHPTSGKDYKFAITLNETEALEFNLNKTEAEHQNFLNKIIKDRQNEIENLLNAKFAEEVESSENGSTLK